MYGAPDCALEEEIVTMRPHPASIMSGRAAWMQVNVPVRFTARIRSPRFGSDVGRRLERLDARRRDQRGDGTQLRANVREGAAHRGPIRDVDPAGDRLDALLAELGGALFGRLAVEVEQGNAVAVGPEPPGDAQADTRRGPGHDHNPAHAALPWSC